VRGDCLGQRKAPTRGEMVMVLSRRRDSLSFMADFKTLRVWQRSRRLVSALHAMTKRFPPAELHGLVSQIQRAAQSIPANIAEGNGRLHRGDQARLYQIALASSRELESHLAIASDIGLVTDAELRPLSDSLDEIQAMLVGMLRYCRRDKR
jgi:four helix bundle protein